MVDVLIIFSLEYADPKTGSGTADASHDSYPTACIQQTQGLAAQSGPPYCGGQDRPRQACKHPR